VAGDGAADEAGLLGIAIRRLRRDHDARAALAALDERARRFPAGALADEADLVRVETLLALDDRAAALRLLEGRDLAAGPRARQALELRGELRAAAGRCADAVADLDRAVGSSDDAVAERGLFARASCLTGLGRYPAARRDLEDYLQRFPDGAHAAAVGEALGRLPGAK
jgi:tetratricopeptide (TPR) repeat protein